MSVTGFTVLKDLQTHYKLCVCKSVPIQTDVLKDKIKHTKQTNKEKIKNGEIISKTDGNISRAKTKIYEYACCNDFTLFATFTLNQTKQDRYDINEYIKNLSQFIRDYRKKTGNDVKYLLIPEKHKNGAWHIHGLLKGLPLSALYKFTPDDNIPQRIKKRLADCFVYEWKEYTNKFGWNTIEEIQNKEACYKYITKYINKDLAKSITEYNKKMYYCSRGLKKADEIYRGHLKSLDQMENGAIIYDYSNDYVSIKNYDKKMYNEADLFDLFGSTIRKT